MPGAGEGGGGLKDVGDVFFGVVAGEAEFIERSDLDEFGFSGEFGVGRDGISVEGVFEEIGAAVLVGVGEFSDDGGVALTADGEFFGDPSGIVFGREVGLGAVDLKRGAFEDAGVSFEFIADLQGPASEGGFAPLADGEEGEVFVVGAVVVMLFGESADGAIGRGESDGEVAAVGMLDVDGECDVFDAEFVAGDREGVCDSGGGVIGNGSVDGGAGGLAGGSWAEIGPCLGEGDGGGGIDHAGSVAVVEVEAGGVV